MSLKPTASPGGDTPSGRRPPRHGVVRVLPIGQDDAALAKALRDGHPHAAATLYERHALHVRRVLARTVGADAELADMLQEVFVQALKSSSKLRDDGRLKAWLTAIAVYTARGYLRRRTRGRWLAFRSPDALPEQHAAVASSEDREALRVTYLLLDKLRADDRIAFALRHIDGMKLEEVAEACCCSLATIKRRLSRAEKTFFGLARRHPALSTWVVRADRRP